MTATTVRIDRRFQGPPDSGNGGYVCGIVAEALGGSGCAVTLHRPPPLDRPLELRADAEVAELFDGEVRIASAVRAGLDLEVPTPPSLANARAAQEGYGGFQSHNFPACFVCGTTRADGLRIFPGAAGPRRVASSWVPDASLAGEDRVVRNEFLWAGLDCPGYWAVEEAAGLALLGRMTAIVSGTAAAGDPLIVSGWEIASESRKHHVGTALHHPDGRLLACARSTWISLAG